MGLDSVELVMAYEEEFDILISDESIGTIRTPRDTGDIIETTLIGQKRLLPREEIDLKVKKITLEQLAVEEEIYTLDSLYIEDFRME